MFLFGHIRFVIMLGASQWHVNKLKMMGNDDLLNFRLFSRGGGPKHQHLLRLNKNNHNLTF